MTLSRPLVEGGEQTVFLVDNGHRIPMTISQAQAELVLIRRERGCTQAAAASMIGITRDALAWRETRRDITARTLDHSARAFGLRVLPIDEPSDEETALARLTDRLRSLNRLASALGLEVVLRPLTDTHTEGESS